MTDKILKNLLLATGLGMATLLASCDEPSYESHTVPVEAVDAEVEAAEEAAEDTSAEVTETPVEAAPVDRLPADSASSEQSVQPESETLFY